MLLSVVMLVLDSDGFGRRGGGWSVALAAEWAAWGEQRKLFVLVAQSQTEKCAQTIELSGAHRASIPLPVVIVIISRFRMRVC